MVRTTQQQLQQRKRRIRARIIGTADRPRLCVSRSLKHIRAQLVDDASSRTLFSADDRAAKEGNKTERAAAVGAKIAKDAKAAGITRVVFDRGGRTYIGRVAALAEAARKGGLQF